MDRKTALLGMTPDELKGVARTLGMPAFAGGQMAKWLYQHRVRSIDEMTDLSKANREKLGQTYEIGCADPVDAQYSQESDCHVAISLHSPLPDQRAELMPAQRGMAIEEVVELLRNYDFSHQRRLSFEYIVFGGVNDSTAHAREIVKLLKGLDCRINLIRFHQIPGVSLRGASEERMEAFRDYLTAHGIFTTIRASRGQDIFAACGLLSTARKTEGRQHE